MRFEVLEQQIDGVFVERILELEARAVQVGFSKCKAEIGPAIFCGFDEKPRTNSFRTRVEVKLARPAKAFGAQSVDSGLAAICFLMIRENDGGDEEIL